MNRCPNCNVILYQKNMQVCPLCQCVTEEVSAEAAVHIKELFGENAPYPDIAKRRRMLRFWLRLVLFLMIVAETILAMINYLMPTHYPWSVITGFTFLYIYLFVVYWVTHDSGFAAKVGLQLLITMVFLFEIDYWNGMNGWSLQWAIPGIILLGDGIVFFLMMLNRSRWQSYLLLLLLMGICSLVILVFYYTHIITNIIMPLVCNGVTFLYFVGTLLLGGGAASRELKRRFHI